MQNPVFERRGRIAQHGVILEIDLGRIQEELTFWPFNGWESPSAHRFRTLAKSKDHLVGIKGFAHGSMLERLKAGLKLVSWLLGSVLLIRGRRQLWPATSEELT